MRISKWSSYVCSSDLHSTRLTFAADVASALFQTRGIAVQLDDARDIERIANELAQTSRLGYEHGLVAGADTAQLDSELSNARAEVTRLQAALRTAKRSLLEIGRASCRERVCQYVYISVVAVSLNNKHR